MSLLNRFFWQEDDATGTGRVVTGSVSVPVADIRSVKILEREEFSEGLYLPQRLKVEIKDNLTTLFGEEARSFLEQLEERDERYEKMVTRWDLGLKTRDHQPAQRCA